MRIRSVNIKSGVIPSHKIWGVICATKRPHKSLLDKFREAILEKFPGVTGLSPRKKERQN